DKFSAPVCPTKPRAAGSVHLLVVCIAYRIRAPNLFSCAYPLPLLRFCRGIVVGDLRGGVGQQDREPFGRQFIEGSGRLCIRARAAHASPRFRRRASSTRRAASTLPRSQRKSRESSSRGRGIARRWIM